MLSPDGDLCIVHVFIDTVIPCFCEVFKALCFVLFTLLTYNVEYLDICVYLGS